MIVSKESGLEKLLNYDWYRHASFIDHFIGNTTIEEFAAAKHREVGDFVLGKYEAKVGHKGDRLKLQFSRAGHLNNSFPVKVTKIFEIASGSSEITCKYKIGNLSSAPIDLQFGVEFNFGLMAGNAHDRYYSINGHKPSDARLRSTGATEGVTCVSLSDEWQKLQAEVEVDKPMTLWRFPIETVSLSKSGIRKGIPEFGCFSALAGASWKKSILSSSNYRY